MDHLLPGLLTLLCAAIVGLLLIAVATGGWSYEIGVAFACAGFALLLSAWGWRESSRPLPHEGEQ